MKQPKDHFLTSEELQKLPVENQIRYLYHVRWNLDFRHLKNCCDSIISYSIPFLSNDNLNEVYAFFLDKLDYTSSHLDQFKLDSKLVFTTYHTGLQQVFLEQVFYPKLRKFEEDAILLRGEQAKNAASDLLTLLNRLKIDARNCTNENAFSDYILLLSRAIHVKAQSPQSQDYSLLLAAFSEQVCLDLLKRYTLLFDSLKTASEFGPKKPIKGTKPFTCRQLALKLFYEKVDVPKTKPEPSLLTEGLNSHDYLYNTLVTIVDLQERTSATSKRSFGNKAKDFEEIINHLEGKAKAKAEKDLEALIQNNKEYL